MGSRDDVAAKIETDTKLKIDEMNKAVEKNKENVSFSLTTSISKRWPTYLSGKQESKSSNPSPDLTLYSIIIF